MTSSYDPQANKENIPQLNERRISQGENTAGHSQLMPKETNKCNFNLSGTKINAENYRYDNSLDDAKKDCYKEEVNLTYSENRESRDYEEIIGRVNLSNLFK